MRPFSPLRIATAVAASAAIAAAAGAQSEAPATQSQETPQPTFAPPVRIKVAGKWLGSERLYPSPALHDVDGDGHDDLVIGDLRGLLTVALRKPGKGEPAWAAETKLLASDGKPLDFHNW